MPKLNIYHRKDKRWEGRISRGKQKNGTRKFQYILGKTREDVAEKMMQIYKSEHSVTPLSKKFMNQIKKNTRIPCFFEVTVFFASLGYDTKVAKNI